MTTIQDLAERLDSLQQSYEQSQRNQVPITAKTDAAYGKIPQIDTNTQGVATNANDILVTQEGVAESYEETSTAITEVEEALAEIYEMIVPAE